LLAPRPGKLCGRGVAPERDAPRYSGDIDVFHDREERVATAALEDAKALEAAGYEFRWLRQLPLIYTAEVKQANDGTRLEWIVDSDFRFFPTVKDETFGYILHPVDSHYPAADWLALQATGRLTRKTS
jgi:hypothetical protein